MSSPDSYMKDVTDDPSTLPDPVAHDAQNSPRGRAMSHKDLSTLEDGQRMVHNSKSLKIKLTLPAGFRKRPMEVVSRPSRKLKTIATAIPLPGPAPKRGRPRKIKNSGEADEYAPP